MLRNSANSYACLIMKMLTLIVLSLSLTTVLVSTSDITFKDGGYSGIVIAVDEQVPVSRCREVLQNLEVALTAASRKVHSALDSRAYFRSAIVLLPDSWPNNCTGASGAVTSHGQQEVHFLIDTTHPVHGDTAYTTQSEGCYRQGERVTLSHRLLEDGAKVKDVGHLLAAQWIKFRYGAFDERGFLGDPIYPACYATETSDNRVTGCSDQPIDDQSACAGEELMLAAGARSSLLTSARAERLCDATVHDRFAPSKHNFVCARISSQQVVDAHPDFANSSARPPAVVAVPATRIEYKRRSVTRFVLVVAEAKLMDVREAWLYLRVAVRKFALLDLPSESMLGLVIATEEKGPPAGPLETLVSRDVRDSVASRLPYSPRDIHASTCLHCGINTALDMLSEKAKDQGPAVSVIVVIAPGHPPSAALSAATARAVAEGVSVTTINYPETRLMALDSIAKQTGGLAFSVAELRCNIGTSYLTTYFQLATAFLEIAQTYCPNQGVPLEIHRRELWDGPTSGSFYVEDVGMGDSDSSRFAIFAHNPEIPLLGAIVLRAPSGLEYSTKLEKYSAVKMLMISAELNETGTWTYKIDRKSGNQQPHIVQVLLTPRDQHGNDIVRARAWLSGGAIFVRVNRGKHPVLGARVVVVAFREAANRTAGGEKFRLYDSGNGDPDLTRNDGVYSRTLPLSPSTYHIEVSIDDNSNTAYSYQANASHPPNPPPCCGSSVPPPPVRPTAPFTRHLPPITMSIGPQPASRVGDLRTVSDFEQLKTRLLFTAPEPMASRHEVRFARNLPEIVDTPLVSSLWQHGTPLPLPPHSDNSFTLDFSRNPSLLDTPLFLCVVSYFDDQGGEMEAGRGCSNWQRVLMPSPMTTPSMATEGSDWTADFVPSQASAGIGWLELVLPVVGGVLLLVVCLAGYCVVCRKRRGKNGSGRGTPPAIVVSPSVISSPQFDSEKRPLGCDVNEPVAAVTPVRPPPGRQQRTLSPYESWTASQLLHEHERRSSPYGEVQFNAPGGGIYEEGGRYFIDTSPEAPPVPPLPYSLYSPGPIYGVSPAALSCHRNGNHGSVSSVSSGEKKKRNVTMV